MYGQGAAALAAAAIIAMSLAACTSVSPEFTTAGLKRPSAMCSVDPTSIGDAEALEPFERSDGCGIPNPWRVSSVGEVALSKPATLNCGMVDALDQWVEGVVQPAAYSQFGERVVQVHVAASYACRARNNQRGAKLSEHGLGNAIDISSFTLASGRTVAVQSGWSGNNEESGFLRRIDEGSCGPFKTFLGPGANRAHRDHFHLDLAQHGRSGTGTYCR